MFGCSTNNVSNGLAKTPMIFSIDITLHNIFPEGFLAMFSHSQLSEIGYTANHYFLEKNNTKKTIINFYH